jgi:Domain of unknown function (DUF5679)
MAKRSRPTEPPVNVAGHASGGRRQGAQAARAELAELGATEAKRLARLNKVRARATAVRTRLTTRRTTVADGGGAAGVDGPPTGPIGYCMREKRPVQISDPEPVTLSNGRRATAGTCSTCGARVVALSARAAPIDD